MARAFWGPGAEFPFGASKFKIFPHLRFCIPLLFPDPSLFATFYSNLLTNKRFLLAITNYYYYYHHYFLIGYH
jgi:hypothetical protein